MCTYLWVKLDFMCLILHDRLRVVASLLIAMCRLLKMKVGVVVVCVIYKYDCTVRNMGGLGVWVTLLKHVVQFAWHRGMCMFLIRT